MLNADGMPDGIYYTCSDRQEHHSSCHEIPEDHEARQFGYTRLFERDGRELGCQEIDKYDVLITQEKKKWEELGIMPQAFQLDGVQTDAKLATLFNILEHIVEIPRDKMDEMFKKMFLQKLTEAREGVEPQIQMQRRMAIAAGPMPIIGPDGKPMKFQ